MSFVKRGLIMMDLTRDLQEDLVWHLRRHNGRALFMDFYLSLWVL